MLAVQSSTASDRLNAGCQRHSKPTLTLVLLHEVLLLHVHDSRHVRSAPCIARPCAALSAFARQWLSVVRGCGVCMHCVAVVSVYILYNYCELSLATSAAGCC
jgi:hypothetical protein